jgi:plastocyanin
MRLHLVQRLLVVSVIALAAFAQADGLGNVRFDASSPQPAAAQYRTRTRTPILPADGARAIVWLTRKDGDYPANVKPAQAPVHKEVRQEVLQEGYQFRPGMLAVRVGSAVTFPNRDDEFHSVFSYSQAKRFDLGRFRKDEESPPVIFDQPGVVKIYCEIHRHMRSILLVLESPWFTVTDETGHFRLTAIPPGEYEVHAYMPDDQQPVKPLSVAADATVQVELGG